MYTVVHLSKADESNLIKLHSYAKASFTPDAKLKLPILKSASFLAA